MVFIVYVEKAKAYYHLLLEFRTETKEIKHQQQNMNKQIIQIIEEVQQKMYNNDIRNH